MKDELDGNIIKEAYFLGIKQYGFWYLKDNIKIEKSVWAGITRNTLTFQDIKDLHSGITLNRRIKARFFKSIINLDIIIKPIVINIKFLPHKILQNNIYKNIRIEALKYNDLFTKIKYLLKKYLNSITKFIKIFK